MKINNLDLKNITVVVQGAFNNVYTPLCLDSIRKYLPGSSIILSTWEDTKLNTSNYDKLLLNKDPGSLPNVRGQTGCNINRQIVSTLNALKEVKTKYSFKIRTDMALVENNFLNFYMKLNKYIPDPKFKIFEDRVLISYYCEKACFNIMDFFYFGNTSDLIKIFDIPLREKGSEDYMKTHEAINKEKKGSWTAQYEPDELYITFQCILKNMPELSTKFRDYTEITPENFEISDKFYVNNFFPVCSNECGGIAFLKDSLIKHNKYDANFDYFFSLYKKYCDSEFQIKSNRKEYFKYFNAKELRKYNNFSEIYKNIEKCTKNLNTIKRLFNNINNIN